MVSLDLYTQNIPLTQKAKFWTNYVSSLKGDAIMHLQFIIHCILNNIKLLTIPLAFLVELQMNLREDYAKLLPA